MTFLMFITLDLSEEHSFHTKGLDKNFWIQY